MDNRIYGVMFLDGAWTIDFAFYEDGHPQPLTQEERQAAIDSMLATFAPHAESLSSPGGSSRARHQAQRDCSGLDTGGPGRARPAVEPEPYDVLLVAADQRREQGLVVLPDRPRC